MFELPQKATDWEFWRLGMRTFVSPPTLGFMDDGFSALAARHDDARQPKLGGNVTKVFREWYCVCAKICMF